MPNESNNVLFSQYLSMLERPFIKICRLRFLQPDGSTAFAIDNNYKNIRSRSFISGGTLNVNLQNGQRRSASVSLANINDQFDYNVNRIWFGQEIALDEGLVLQNGEEFYIQQGIFEISNPTEAVNPEERTISYDLVDKWSNIDGSLGGNLESTYEVAVGTNIFAPISALLAEDKGNGYPIDRINPIYTVYYNDKTQELPDGTIVSMIDSPYTLTVEGGSTKADVILGLASMLNALVGYDATGALRIDASQDDIDDSTKPIVYSFSQDRISLLGLTYTTNINDVYNDYIVIGEQLDDYTQPSARVQNLDPKSDTNINIIGRKTYREVANGFATDVMCRDLATYRLKKSTVLQKSVSISCSQVLHLQENQLVEVCRTDKEGSPVERHLIQGFSRPLVGTDEMTISCVSVNDYPELQVSF